MRHLLTSPQQTIFDWVKAASMQTGMAAFLVGGAVRDWLLNTHTGDLDFVIEAADAGDAITFARALQAQHGGAVLAHEKFRTATWTIAGHAYDFASTRRETYAHPAALPTVSPANIDVDLRRRDFTINAIALRLSDDAVLDPFDGQGDLRRGEIRILHPRSFADDPTRIFRAARYAARLGFVLDAATHSAINSGLPHLRSLSGERAKYDIELIFEEAQPANALALLQQWDVFRALAIPLPDAHKLRARFERIRAVLATDEWPLENLGVAGIDIVHAAGWSAITYNTGMLGVSRWVDWLPYTAALRDALVAQGALSTASAALFRGSKPSQQSALLKEFSGLALLMGFWFDPDLTKRAALLHEWRDWRWAKPATTGDDLRALGVPPGPIYATLLHRLRDAWLDGEVQNLDEERALLRRLMGQ
jgi:tRNA nucleotidyltransferase (CCA-adding enzyme)